MDKFFTFIMPQVKPDLNNGRSVPVGHLEIDAIARLFNDKTLREIDINAVVWIVEGQLWGTDVTTYIKECHPDLWDEIGVAAKNNYANVTVQKSATSGTGGQ